MKIFYLYQMLDIISKDNSRKDVSKEKINYFSEKQKKNIDDDSFGNFNLSNNFEDNSTNEMISFYMNIPSILINEYKSEKSDINNNFISSISYLSPSPPFIEFSNDSLLSINSMIKEPFFLSKKKGIPKNNDIRKVKKNICNSALKYANDKILKTFNYDIGNGINKRELKKIDPKYISNFKTDFNKQLLETTLGEIFSQNISAKITNFPKDFNKELINKLLNEEDLKKRKIFENLFNRTFLDCINHIKGKKKFNELTGLEKFFEKEINLKENGEELKELFNNFEDTISSKKPRKSRN